MRPNQIPVLLRSGGGAGFSVDFTLGANGDPLSGYPGPWSGTTNITLWDNSGSYTRGMHSTNASFTNSSRDSTLWNGTFTSRIRTATTNTDFSNMACRLTSGGNGGIIFVAHSSSLTWRIQIYDTGNTLQLDYDTTVAFTPGNVHDRKIVASGSSVTGYINGVQVGVTQTDSWNPVTSTYVSFGINGNGATDTTIENMAARP